jgi:hypothetical protein
MMHVFLLMVYLGVGDSRKVISDNMYFRSVTDCNFYAKELTKRYGNYQSIDRMDSRDRVTAYCVPKYIKKDSIEVY